MGRARAARTLQETEEPGVSKDRQLADLALDPVFGGAIIAATFGRNVCGATYFTALYEALYC